MVPVLGGKHAPRHSATPGSKPVIRLKAEKLFNGAPLATPHAMTLVHYLRLKVPHKTLAPCNHQHPLEVLCRALGNGHRGTRLAGAHLMKQQQFIVWRFGAQEARQILLLHKVVGRVEAARQPYVAVHTEVSIRQAGIQGQQNIHFLLTFVYITTANTRSKQHCQ
ncbi:ORF060R [Largemouth bass ulcerative syndrome virus]|nr:ORF060R [Largemouth bass ulcerative syndrome virus]